MSKMIEGRKLDFIPPSRYDKLDKDVREKLLDYRRLFSKVVRKERKIDNLLKQIDKDKDILKDWKKDLTSKNHFIDHLRKTFNFTCSVVSLTPRPSGKVYHNLTISRRRERPKNCSLGSDDVMLKHLLEYYKGNSKVRKEIKDDGWKVWLKVETNSGKTYLRILDMIMDNPLGFKDETLNRNVLFPLDKKKCKTKK